MAITRSIVLFCLSLSMVACNRYNIQAIDAPEGPTSTLVIYRPQYASAAPAVVAIDGVDIALLRNETYLEISTSAGPHVISVRGFRVGLTDEKNMTLQENAVLRLKVDNNGWVMAGPPLVMHLSKLYYLEEDNSLSLEDLKKTFTRVNVSYK